MAQTKVSLVDLNSNELILDLDGDTTLHSSTDDQIDIKIAGADDFTFTAGAFNVLASSHAVFADSSEAKFGAGTDLQIYHDGTNSFIANKTGALKIATETSGIAITIGHTTSEVTVADNLTVTGNANIGGSLTFADGSIALADIDIDGGTDIGAAIVDADLFIVDDGAGGTNRKVTASRIKTYIGSTTAVDDLTLGDAAVTIATSSGNITIDAQAGDTDIIFKGTDSSSDITALTLDMSDAGTAVFNHDIRIADDGQIGSASDADAIVINSSGVVTMNQIPVFSAGLNVSGGTIAGTLSTAAQTNITSLGTLTALTVDDVAIDGKVITMTGSSSDTAVITAGTNGTLSIVTTDDAAAAANIQITADGTFEVDGTTITLDSAGDIVFDAGGNDFNFKAGGTEVLRISNSSSDVIIKPIVDAKDIIFQQRDGTEVARIEDNATFNVVTGKLAINGTAITSTAAELNLLDGVSGLVQADLTKLAAVDSTAAELNIVDGGTSATSTTVADADRVVMNDNGTMVQVAVTDLSAYFDDEITVMPNLTTTAGLVTVGAAGTATTLAGIPHLTEDTSIYIGSSPTSSSDTAADNVAVGMSAMDAITTGDKNIAIGKNAAGALTTGDRNVFIGDSSGDAATAASQNTGIGNDAFTSLTDGDHNVGIGVNVFAALTTGHRNISIGQTSSDGFDTEDDNLAIGTGALGGPVAGGEYNVAIGNNALDALTSADNNTVLGYQAGSGLTDGGYNVLIGKDAGLVTNGGRNVMIGTEVADAATSCDNNVIIGDGAVGTGVLTGNQNIVIGSEAGKVMTSATDTVLIGYQAGQSMQSSPYSVCIGRSAGEDMVSNRLTAIGYYAGANTTATGNTFLGFNTGSANIGGEYNVAMGYNALYQPDGENYNVAIGTDALGGAIAGGEQNVAVGTSALVAVTSGDANTAIGHNAGVGITTGDYNVAIGEDNMTAACTGDYNHIIGRDSGKALTSGHQNVAIGGAAGYSITEGHDNIALGHDGGRVYTTGDHNISIGYKSSGSGVDVSNEILIGHGAGTTNFVAGGTGTVRLGMHNNYITNTFTSNANWAHSSDERWKKNINNNDIGLDFINDLRTVTYNWKAFSEIDPSLSEYNAEDTEYPHPEIQHGLIAQEVKSALEKNGINQFAGWYEDQGHADKQQGISESMYVIPLIKAVQELSAQVTTLQDEIKTLKDK